MLWKLYIFWAVKVFREYTEVLLSEGLDVGAGKRDEIIESFTRNDEIELEHDDRPQCGVWSAAVSVTAVTAVECDTAM